MLTNVLPCSNMCCCCFTGLYGLIQKATRHAGSWTRQKDQGGWGGDFRDVISTSPRSSSYQRNTPNTRRPTLDPWVTSLIAALSLRAHQNSREDCRWMKRSGRVVELVSNLKFIVLCHMSCLMVYFVLNIVFFLTLSSLSMKEPNCCLELTHCTCRPNIYYIFNQIMVF